MYRIKNVNWINLEEKKIEIKDVHIPGTVDVTIDGTGKYLMPGLVDMHTHITPASARHYLYSGVTSVRNTGGNFDLIHSIDRVSPKIYATYRFIDGDPGLWGATSYGNISTNDTEQAAEAVDELYEQKARFVKVYGNIQENILKTVTDKSRSYNLEAAGDFLQSKSIDALKAARFGVTWLEHASGIIQSLYPDFHPNMPMEQFDTLRTQEVDENKLTRVLTSLIDQDVKIVPTLSLYAHLSKKGRSFNGNALADSKQLQLFDNEEVFTVNDQFSKIETYLDSDFMEKQTWQLKIVKKITEKYLALCGEVYIGTDAPAGTWVYPGLSMIEELNEFKSLGLNAYEVLYKATVEARKVTGEDDGYILLNENPVEHFENILNIESVFVSGKHFTHTEIAGHRIDTEKMHMLIDEITSKY